MPARPVRPLLTLAAVVAGLAGPVAVSGAAYTHVPEPTSIGRGGAAATVDGVATRAAIRTLRQGGNAVDATVAAAAVLGVTEPFSCGIGGGGFMLIREPDGEVTSFDSRETAPAAMTPDAFIEGGTPLPFNAARYSGLSAGVPGTIAGWDEALERHGTLSLREAIRPAIDVARKGFVIDQTFFSQIEGNVPYFADVPSSKELFLDPDGTPRDVGTVLRNPDLARTYRAIARDGRRAFYRGEIARDIVDAVRTPPTAAPTHTWRPGVMTLRDLRAYDAIERRPTRTSYRGLDVYSMAPPSSGGTTVGEALNILEGYDLASLSRTDALHRFLEASRLAFADRNAFVADPAYYDVPVGGLLSDDFAATRRALIDPARAATSPVAPGDPRAFDPSGGDDAGQPAASVTRAGTTTHLTVSDREGQVVSYTFTIESTGGNGIVVPGRGFLLNNELTDFNFDSTTHPNRVEGGKRPRSSMAPTIVDRDGAPLLAVGSPGGSTIITTVLEVLVKRLDLGATLPEAVAAPRASQRNTAATSAEPAFIASPEGQALAALGHAFTSTAEIGAVTGIEFLGGGRVLAAAEPARRGGGSARVTRRSDLGDQKRNDRRGQRASGSPRALPGRACRQAAYEKRRL
jgi:gamma-glutamyltranspeptidase/glutathione hydrolase